MVSISYKHSKSLWLLLIIAALSIAFSSVPAHADEQRDFFGSWNGRISIANYLTDGSIATDGNSVLHAFTLRLIKEDAFDDSINYQLHLLGNFTLSTREVFFDDMLDGNQKYRCFDLDDYILNKDKARLRALIDRANIRIRYPSADLTIGRQAISFGKAWFWSPLDVYLPFDAQSIDREYKAGVDAIRLEIPLGLYSGLDIVGVGGNCTDTVSHSNAGKKLVDCDWYGSSLLLHYFSYYDGWDYSFQAGKIYGGYQIGGGLVGEIGEYQVRGEAAYFLADDSPKLATFDTDLYPDNFQFSLGVNRYLPNNLSLDLEYFHNGAADPDNINLSYVRMSHGASRHLSRNLIGLNITQELHPLWMLQVASIYSIDDSSFTIQPVFTRSVSNFSDFQIGISLFFGKSPQIHSAVPLIRSEFGAYPNMIYMEYRYHF